jgi:iron(III) transport system substrate-binding protein
MRREPVRLCDVGESSNRSPGVSPLPVHRRRALAWMAGAVAASGCGGRGSTPHREVVVYTALDREFSEPLLRIYEKRNGVEVLAAYDVESTKSFGLERRIETESRAPACDLFWNNEILNTVRLKRKGLLSPFHPAGAAAFPAAFRDPEGLWYGFAARARILLVNTDLVSDAERPRRLLDLLEPRWKDRLAIAKPLFGTTGTQAASLFANLGEAEAKAFYTGLRNNGVLVLSGNRQSAAAAGSGRVAVALTDTDDALAEIDAGNPVTIIYPDREPDQWGTLFVPNTLARIKNAPHPDEAEELAGFLLGPRVEAALAQGPSGQIPLNPAVDVATRVETPRTAHPMTVDFDKAAALWESVVAPFLVDLFGAEE